MQLICPKCRSNNVQHSRRRAIESLFPFFNPFRCMECWHRFYAPINPFHTLSFKLLVAATVLLLLIFLSLPYIFKTVFDDRVDKRSTVPAFMGKNPLKNERIGMTEIRERLSAVTEKKKAPLETAPFRTENRQEVTVEKKTVQKTSVKAKQGETLRPELSEKDHQASLHVAGNVVRSIVDIKILSRESGVKVFLTADQPVTDYKHQFISSPPRLVIDLPGKWKKPTKPFANISNEKFTTVRFGLHAEKLRVVFDMKSDKSVVSDISGSPKGLLITFK